MNRQFRRFVVLMSWILVQSLAIPVTAQDKVLTPEMILRIRQAADAQISPDGSRVMVQVSRPRTADEKLGSAVPELWLVPSSGGEPARFTTNDEGDRAARWSPDGRTIAFLSRRPGNEFTQVYLLPVGGGEAHRLTNAENAVSAFKWAPDGKSVAYTVTDPKTKDERDAESKGKDWNRRRHGLQALPALRDRRRVEKEPPRHHHADDGSRFRLVSRQPATRAAFRRHTNR